MQAEIITIGDEILIGQVIDTNSAWIAEELNGIGIHVKQITSIPDNHQHILDALKEAEKRADLILLTGGLGPTRDDITKQTLCEYFNTKLIFSEETFINVKRLFNSFGKEVTEINRKQAEVPENAVLMSNKQGTAPGMWFEKGEKVFVSMPGVPYEMKAMMENVVLPKIKSRFDTPAIVHRTILTQGIGESFLADKIAPWENELEREGIKLAYLPSPGMVRLRLSVTGENENQLIQLLEDKIKTLQKLIPKYIYGYDTNNLETIIGELLKNKNRTLSVAESCTGGYLAHLITRIPGSSNYFKGGIISYSNESKMSALGVKPTTLEKYGAVSEQVTNEMAEGVRAALKTDFAISTSGIAGPEGGTNEKPIGTVWIGIATPEKVFSKKFLFGENRERNIHNTAIAALNLLRKEII